MAKATLQADQLVVQLLPGQSSRYHVNWTKTNRNGGRNGGRNGRGTVGERQGTAGEQQGTARNGRGTAGERPGTAGTAGTAGNGRGTAGTAGNGRNGGSGGSDSGSGSGNIDNNSLTFQTFHHANPIRLRKMTLIKYSADTKTMQQTHELQP